LSVLTSSAGREQLLLEHGYLKPGDRFLLFPITPEEERAAALPKNDLSPHPPSMQIGEADDSAWQRAGRTIGRAWQRFSGEAPTGEATAGEATTGEATASATPPVSQ
jgi:hypothetical protein